MSCINLAKDNLAQCSASRKISAMETSPVPKKKKKITKNNQLSVHLKTELV